VEQIPPSYVMLRYVMWVPVTTVRTQIADGGDAVQIWGVAANILNKKVDSR